MGEVLPQVLVSCVEIEPDELGVRRSSFLGNQSLVHHKFVLVEEQSEILIVCEVLSRVLPLLVTAGHVFDGSMNGASVVISSRDPPGSAE